MKNNLYLLLVVVFLTFLFSKTDSVFAAGPFPQGSAEVSACTYNYNTIRYVSGNTTTHKPDPNYDWVHCGLPAVGTGQVRRIWLPDSAQEVQLFQLVTSSGAKLIIDEFNSGQNLYLLGVPDGQASIVPPLSPDLIGLPQIILRKSLRPDLGQIIMNVGGAGWSQVHFNIKKLPTSTPSLSVLPGTFSLNINTECSGSSPRNSLSWTASNGASNYQVFRNGHLLTTTNSLGYTDTQILPGSQNTYTVTAKNSVGTKSTQVSVTAKSDCQPITSIDLDIATSCNSMTTQNNLSWTLSGNGPFELTRSPNFLTGTKTITSSPNSFIDTGVIPGVLYSYTIRAIGSNNQVSNSVNARTDCEKLNTFTMSLSTACVGQVAQNTVTWTSSGGRGVNYRIFRDNLFNLLQTQTGLTFTDITPTSKAIYTYIVQAIDSSGSIITKSAYITTNNCLSTIVCTPENTVTWSKIPDSSAVYDVYRNGVVIASNLSGNSYIDKNLTARQRVNYTVRAKVGSRVSPHSNRIVITSHDCIPPFNYTFTVQPSLLLVSRGRTGLLTAIARDNRGRNLLASGTPPIAWTINTTKPGDISPKSNSKTTTFTATTSCESLREASTAIVTATATFQGITKSARATVNVQDICSAEVIGDVFAEGTVANLTVDDRSIIAAGKSIIEVDGKAVKLTDYQIGERWDEFKKSQIEITKNLINERAKKLPTGYKLSSVFNLNPDGPSNPEGGVFYVPGNLTIDKDVTFSGKGTIIVEGRIIFPNGKRKLSYTDPSKDIVGFISLKGDLRIPALSQIKGAFFVADGSITVVGTVPGGTTKAEGLFVADEIKLEGQNTTIIYDGRIVTNPPLGFAEHFVPTINEARP